MSKHTPGPWEFDGISFIYGNDPGKEPIVGQVRGWGYLTGKGYGALGLDEDEAIAIQEANGRLLAAAPELLKASERVVQWFKDNGQKLPMDSAPDCVRCLDEAIAKARGRGWLVYWDIG